MHENIERSKYEKSGSFKHPGALWSVSHLCVLILVIQNSPESLLTWVLLIASLIGLQWHYWVVCPIYEAWIARRNPLLMPRISNAPKLAWILFRPFPMILVFSGITSYGIICDWKTSIAIGSLLPIRYLLHGAMVYIQARSLGIKYVTTRKKLYSSDPAESRSAIDELVHLFPYSFKERDAKEYTGEINREVLSEHLSSIFFENNIGHPMFDVWIGAFRGGIEYSDNFLDDVMDSSLRRKSPNG